MTRGDDLAASVGRSRRACVWPPFKRGAPRSGGGSGFPRGSIPPPRCARQLLLSKGRLRRGTCPARAQAESRPSAPGATRAAACPGSPVSFTPVCALGRLSLQGQVFGGQSFSSSLMLFGTTGPACRKTAPDIRARRLGIRQPQKGSFHGMLRCPCSEYIPSIPAPVASPDAKISLFAVRSSFAGAIFRSDKIENTGNTCVYFRCFLYSMGGKEPRKTYRLPNLRAHLGLLAYGIRNQARALR